MLFYIGFFQKGTVFKRWSFCKVFKITTVLFVCGLMFEEFLDSSLLSICKYKIIYMKLIKKNLQGTLFKIYCPVIGPESTS